ncbi:MBG domain-containing protein [uncultured Tenacibaculum sp.]|uniref:MBG domain-containing protein n=1 Tax=uncultured Tenacibaculum sp. TaxID=174713 RepID=UPI002616752E|nr:MBG domain-containing protein [uncultured Tenacibaculum sp.]
MKKTTLLYVMFLCLMITQTFSQTFNEVENNNSVSNTLISSQSRIYSSANYEGTVTSSDSDFWIISRKATQASDIILYFDRLWVNSNPGFDFRIWEYRGGNWGVTPVNIGTLRTLMQVSGIYNYSITLPYSNNVSGGNSNNFYAIEVFTGAANFNYNFKLGASSVNSFYYCYEFGITDPVPNQVNDADVTLNDLRVNGIDDVYYIVKFSATNSFTDFTDAYVQNQALPVKAANNSYSGSGEHIAYVGTDNGALQAALTMTNLQRNTAYYYKVYTYSNCNGYINYNNSIASIPVTTCPGTAPGTSSVNSVSATSPTSATINTLGRPAGADTSMGYLVKFSDTNSFTAPVSGTTIPVASLDYSGKTGEQVVYTGAIGSGVGSTDAINQVVTGLQVNKDYYVKVYTYDLCGGKYNFETTGSTVVTTNYVCAAPSAANNVTANATGTSTMTLSSFTGSSAANGSIEYIVKLSDSNSFTTPNAVPGSSSTVYNSAAGGEQVMYVGNSVTPNLNITGLAANGTYYVKVYAYNNCGGTNYFETTGSTSVTITTCGTPTGNAQLASFREDLNWENRVSPIISNVPADAEGQIVKMNIENSFTDITGVQNTLPTANVTYSGSGEQVILAGAFPNGQAFTGHNLLPNTEYFFRIYSYKECNGQYYFSSTNDSTSKFTAGVSTKLASNTVVNNLTGTAFTLASFTGAPAADNGNGIPTGYIVKMNTTNSFSSYGFRSNLPASNANYSGGEQVVYVGTSTTPNLEITGLTANATYYFAIYAYRDHGSPYFFKSYQQTGHQFSITNNAALVNPTITFDNVQAQVGDANFNLSATSNSTGTITYEIINDGGTGTTLSGTNNATVTIGNKAGIVIVKASQAATATHQSAVKTMTLTINNQPATLSGFIGYQVNSGITTLDMTTSLTSASTGAYTFEIIGPDLGYSVNGNLLNVNNVAGSIIVKVTQAADANYGESTAYFSTLFYNAALSPKVPAAHNLFDFSLDVGETKTIVAANNVFSTSVTYSIVDNGGTGSTIIGNVFTAGNTPGTVTLRSSTVEDTGYLATTKDVTVTVTGTLPQNITFGALATKTYGDTTFNLSATSNSGLPVSYASSDTSIATISGNTVTIIGAGTVTITASQAGNAIYDLATDVQQNLVINKKMLVVSPKDATATYGILDLPADNSTENYPFQVEGLVNGDLATNVLRLSTSFSDISDLVIVNAANPGQPLNVGTHTGVMTWGTPPIIDILSPNYEYRANATGNLTVTAAPITVTAEVKSKSYDGGSAADPVLTYTVDRSNLPTGADVINYPNPLVFTGGLNRVSGQNAGAYAINQGTLSLGSNYAITFNSANFTINKVDLTATSVSNKVYGDALGTLPIQYTGFVNGENATVIGTQPNAIPAIAIDGTTPAGGPYVVNVSGGTDNNYNIVTNNGTVTVTKRALNAVVENKTKVFGDANPTFTMQYSNFVNGDDESVITQNVNLGAYEAGSTLVSETSPVGSYVITNLPGLFIADNYFINFTNLGVARLTVSKKAIEVTAEAKSKVYGDADPTFTYQITNGNLVGSDAFTGSLSRVTGENVGTYAIDKGTLALNANYDVSFVADNLTISKRAIEVTADVKSKVYGDSDPALTYRITNGSLVGSDVFTGSLTREAGETVFNSLPSNPFYAITQGTLALNANYDLTFVDSRLRIAPRNVNFSLENTNKVYGEGNPIPVLNIVDGTAMAYDDALVLKNVRRKSGENIGTYEYGGFITNFTGDFEFEVTSSHSTDLRNYQFNFRSYGSPGLTITKKSIEVTADVKSKVYGDSDPTLTYQVTNGSLVGSDAFTGTLSRNTGENVGNYAVTQGSLTLGNNYTLSFVSNDLTINKKDIEVTVDAGQAKSFGTTDPTFIYRVTSGALVNGDTFTGALSRLAGENAGTYAINQGTLALNANYNLSFVPNSFEIHKGAATVIVNNLTQTYDGTAKPVSPTTMPNGLSVDVTYDGGSTVPTNAGTYTVLATVNDVNYQGNTTETLTINKANQVITFGALSNVTYGDTSFNLTATSDSGLGVTYSSSDTSVATISGNTVTIVGTGSTTITANQVGNINYNAANVQQTLTVGKKAIEITADAKTKVYGDADPAFTYTVTNGSLVGSDAFTGSLTRATGEAQGNYGITQGTLALNSNYDVTFVGANFYIDYRFIRIVPTAAVQKTYGDSDPAKLNFPFAITQGSLAFDDAIEVFGTFRDSGENVGSYQIRGLSSTFTSTNGGQSSYSITYTHAGSVRLQINQRAIEVTADAKSKAYGDTDPALTYQVTNGALQFSDAFTGTLERVAGEALGSYAINKGTLTPGNNYAVTFVGDNLTIGKRAIEVTADVKTKAYGDADPVFTYQITNGSLAGSDAFIGILERAPGESLGTYAINQGTLGINGNYTISFVSKDLTIGKRAIEVTADAKSKVYGDADPALTYQITSGSLAGSDAFTGNLERVSGDNFGTYAINQGTLALNSNYAVTYVSNDLTITKKDIMILTANQEKEYGEVDSNIAYSLFPGSILANGDSLSGSLTREAGENVGIYNISLGTLSAGPNYNMTLFGSPTFEITKRVIEVTADAKSKEYGALDPTLTYQITSGSLAGSDSFTGGIVRVTGNNAGTYAINQGTLALDNNYTLNFVNNDFTITKRPVTITADALVKVIGDADPALTFKETLGSILVGDSYTGTLERVAGETLGNYAINQGTVTAGNNYTITYVVADLEIIEKKNATALNFEGPANGTYDYIEVADDSSLDFTSAFTFETWVNFDEITRYNNGWDWQCLFAKSRFNESYGLMLLTEGSKILRFYHAGFGTGHTDFNWTSTLAAKKWYHLAVTFNGTKATIYVDGVEVASQTDTASNLVPNNNSLMIGANKTAGADPYPLQGTLDEVRFWNVARTATEINDYKSNELEGNETGLVLYYDMNQGNGFGNNTTITQVTDKSSVGNNGTLNQFALTGRTSNFVNDVTNGVTPKQDQVITFNAIPTKTYGDANFNLTATSDKGLDIVYASSNSSVATVSGNTVTIVGVGTTTITASQQGTALVKSASATQSLTVIAGANKSVWNGNTSSIWTIATNWSDNIVPTITGDAIIPNVTTTPEVGTTVQLNDLTVESLASFDINENGSVMVDGNLDNSGNFTMTSTETKSSTLIVKGTSNGQVTYERGGLKANVWSIVSAPVAGQSIKEFAENSANDIRVNTSVTPNRYAIAYYDDSKPAGSKWVYYTTDDLATNTLTFEKGRSYAVSRATNGSVTFTGTIETTDVAKSIVASEWNAIGNPYTAFLPINENAGTNFINSNVSKFNPANVGVYVWDNAQAKYVGKSLITGESSLAPGQGFFVKAAVGVSNVTFNQSQRKVQPLTGGNFSKGGAVVPSIQLLATSKGVTIDTNIKYFENTTEGLDPGYDLGNYARASFDVFTRFVGNDKGEDFTIQSLPVESVNRTVLPIGLNATAGAEVTFTVNYNNLPEGVEVFIEDKEENTFTKLSSELNEFYTVTITEKVNGVGRFYLRTQQKAKVNTKINNVKIYNTSDNTLIIEGISKGTFNMTLYAIHGAAVLSKTVEGKGRNTVSLPDLETGVYVVRITSELGKKSKKIIIKK